MEGTTTNALMAHDGIVAEIDPEKDTGEDDEELHPHQQVRV